MDNESTYRPQSVDKSGDQVIGRAVRLRKISDLHKDLHGIPISKRGLKAWIRSLNIPIIYIGRQEYINVHFFYMAVYAITRPGSPDFLVPGSDPIKKGREMTHPHTRELTETYFREHIHTFVSEIITFRRMAHKNVHRTFVNVTNHIVDRIVDTYNNVRVIDAFSDYKRRAGQALEGAHASPEKCPLQVNDARITSEQRPTDVDPHIAPEINAMRFNPETEKPDENKECG